MLYVRNFWICRKIECPELRKLNWKLCTLYVRNVWLCRKIECPDLREFNGKLGTFSVRNFWICRKIEYTNLWKFNAKFCTLYTHGTSGFAKKFNVHNCGNWTGNCVRYMYVMSGFVKKLNVQNSINSIENSNSLYIRNVWIRRKIDCHSCANSVGNCVHYTYGMSAFVKNWLYGISGFAEEIE